MKQQFAGGYVAPIGHIISYSYTNSIGRKIFNYKEALQHINIEEYLKNPLTCDCSHYEEVQIELV
jgi:hypothetical protein